MKKSCGQQCANEGSSINLPRRRKRNVRTITVAAGFGRRHFAFDQGERLDCLGRPKQRFSSNLAAIKLLKRLEAEVALPGNLTPDEQLTLARYSGWGDTEVLSHTFTQSSGCAPEPCGKLKGLLTEEENELAARQHP